MNAVKLEGKIQGIRRWEKVTRAKAVVGTAAGYLSYVPLVAWEGELANINDGDEAKIEGELRSGSYTDKKTNAKVYTLDVAVTRVIPVAVKPAESTGDVPF
jgi:hypothetical protein